VVQNLGLSLYVTVGRNDSLEGVAIRLGPGWGIEWLSRLELIFEPLADVARVAGHLLFEVFCQRGGARDEQVCMFQQDNQLTGACRVGLTFCLHVGESLPAMLDDAARRN
jgi:hypothetical protein